MQENKIPDILESSEVKDLKEDLVNQDTDKLKEAIAEREQALNDFGLIGTGSVPTVRSVEEVAAAVKAKAAEKAEKVKTFLAQLLANEEFAYMQKYGYNMDGKTKRRTRKAIERLYKKGKIKYQDFSALN